MSLISAPANISRNCERYRALRDPWVARAHERAGGRGRVDEVPHTRRIRELAVREHVFHRRLRVVFEYFAQFSSILSVLYNFCLFSSECLCSQADLAFKYTSSYIYGINTTIRLCACACDHCRAVGDSAMYLLELWDSRSFACAGKCNFSLSSW